MGTHPIFESDFDCLTDSSYIDEPSQAIKMAGTHNPERVGVLVSYGVYYGWTLFPYR